MHTVTSVHTVTSEGPIRVWTWRVSSQEGIRRCEAFAAGNHGVIPQQTALGFGLDHSAIYRLLKSGRWRRLVPRAYVVAGAPLTWATHLAAAKASLEKDFAFSHRTAGALMELDGVPGGHIEIVTTRTPRLPQITVHRVNCLPRQVVHIRGFPVTSAHRTALDLFSVLPLKSAELALDDALRKKLTTIERLSAEYAQSCSQGRNGCRGFRSAVLRRDHYDGSLESRMETKLWDIIKRLPGPAAQPQFLLETPRGRYRLDFAYPEIKLGIEAQSIRWHMGEANFHYDLKRDRHLKRHGWTLLYYTWDDLLDPEGVRREVSRMRRSMERVLF